MICLALRNRWQQFEFTDTSICLLLDHKPFLQKILVAIVLLCIIAVLIESQRAVAPHMINSIRHCLVIRQ